MEMSSQKSGKGRKKSQTGKISFWTTWLFQRDLSSITSSAERKREELEVLRHKQLPLCNNDIKGWVFLRRTKKKKEKRKAGQPWAHCDQIRKQTLLTASKMDIVCSSLVLAQEVWWRCHLLKSVYVQIERRSKTPPCTTHARLGHLSALARRRQSSAALTILFKTSTADSCPSKDNFALETLRYGKMRCMQRVRGFKVHF